MKDENPNKLIDAPEISNPQQSTVKEMIVWWEKRRLIYNIIIVGLSVFLMYDFWDYPWRKMIGGDAIIFDAIVFIFWANVFYTLSWGIGIVRHKVFETKVLNSKRRWALFITGTLFSIIVTDVNFVFQFDVLFR